MCDLDKIYDLDRLICVFLVNKLTEFKQYNTNSHPIKFNNIEEWHRVVQEMIDCFSVYEQVEIVENRCLENEDINKIRHGFELLKLYIFDLWD